MRIRHFYPVIHLLNLEQGLLECEKVVESRADGVFFISHHEDDWLVARTAAQAKKKYPFLKVGINLLSSTPGASFLTASTYELDAIWVDGFNGPTVKNNQLCSETAQLSHRIAEQQSISAFVGVSFKYQPAEIDRGKTARLLCSSGLIPCTSGPGTGKAPDIDKIRTLRSHCTTSLALASGISLDSVDDYLPYVTHYLVASSISQDDYTLDYEKMSALAGRIHSFDAP